MIMKKYSIIICTLLVLAGCSDWLSEDGAPKIDYSLYETEAGIDAALVSAYNYLRLGASGCLLYTSPSPRDPKTSRMPSSA